jgi:hypothetical protein
MVELCRSISTEVEARVGSSDDGCHTGKRQKTGANYDRNTQNDLADVFFVSMYRHPIFGRNLDREQNWRDKLSLLEVSDLGGIATLEKKSKQRETSDDGPELKERPWCTRRGEMGTELETIVTYIPQVINVITTILYIASWSSN